MFSIAWQVPYSDVEKFPPLTSDNYPPIIACSGNATYLMMNSTLLLSQLFPTFSQIIPTSPKKNSNFFQIFPTSSQILLTFSQIFPTFSQKFPTPSQIFPTSSQIFPTFLQIFPTSSQIFPTSSHLHASTVQLSSDLALEGSQNFSTLAPRHVQLVPKLEKG